MGVDREYKIKIATVSDATGAKETAASLEEVGKAGAKAHQEVATEAENTTLKHRDMHAGIRALREEFPLVAHVAHLALNPIGLAVAGIAGAFALWKNRVENLTKALAGIELPDSKATDPGHINALAAAWEKYADSVTKAEESFNSVAAASERREKQIDKEIEQLKKLLAAQKAEALAALEAGKDGMSKGAYAASKAAIEGHYDEEELKAERRADADKLAEKERRGLALAADAKAKRDEAAKIKIGSADDDAKTEASLLARKEAAEKSIDERNKRIADLTDFKNREGKYAPGGGMEGIKDMALMGAKMLGTYGAGTTASEAIDLEKLGSTADQPNIDRYNEFAKQKRDRARLRGIRDEDLSAAAKEEGESRIIAKELPEDWKALNTKAENDDQIAAANKRKRGYEAGEDYAKSPVGKMVRMAGDAEFKHEHHQEASAQEESAWQYFHQSQGAKADVMLRGLAASVANDREHTRRIEEIVKQMEAMKQQNSGSYNHG